MVLGKKGTFVESGEFKISYSERYQMDINVQYAYPLVRPHAAFETFRQES